MTSTISVITMITGVPGAGKSTIARAVAERAARGVHIPVDDLRHMVGGGYRFPDLPWSDAADEQFRLARGTAVHMARLYADAGFDVVIDDCLGPEHDDRVSTAHYLGLLEQATTCRIALRPRLEVVIDRITQRGDDVHGVLRATVPLLHAAQCRDLDADWHVIDTSEVSVTDAITAVTDIVEAHRRSLTGK
jgi:predicted kinase